MLPDFDKNGFLPVGVWECGKTEFAKRFAVFRRSDRRLTLFEKLENLLRETRATGWIAEIIIDGSFVTGTDEPNDIDIILALNPGYEEADVSFWTNRILNARILSEKYGFDVKVEIHRSPGYYKMLDFFQKVKDSESGKGVVKLTQ